MSLQQPEIAVLFEHPEWQLPLLTSLENRGQAFTVIDLKEAAFETGTAPGKRLYFNQASPSAYLRGNTRAVPLALALLEDLEAGGADIVNGPSAFRLELSKSAQISLMKRLGVDHPRTWVFNSTAALTGRIGPGDFPLLLKPNQGGSGARMQLVDSLRDLRRLLLKQPELWFPDQLLLLQERLVAAPGAPGIVRLEFVGGQLLYALRVVSDEGFNLCPSDVCNPDSVTGGPQFRLEADPPPQAVADARRVLAAGGIDIGAVEYMETADGRRVVFDINANSNLRRSLAPELGIDPIDRVVDYLQARSRSRPAIVSRCV